jgi:choline kinase
MKAVILAAGVGSRLGELTRFKPKCLLTIGDRTIIEYQIEALKRLGLRSQDIFVIGGHKFAKLRDFFGGSGVNLIYNAKYDEWNNIYSFYLIRGIREIRGDFMLLNTDTLFHRRIMEGLSRELGNGNYIVVDTDKELGAEEMKVIIQDGVVKRFGKEIDPHEAGGEYIGLSLFNRELIRPVFSTIQDLLSRGLVHLWYEDALNRALDRVEIGYVPTFGLPWIEIDTPEDYKRAEEIFHDL